LEWQIGYFITNFKNSVEPLAFNLHLEGILLFNFEAQLTQVLKAQPHAIVEKPESVPQALSEEVRMDKCVMFFQSLMSSAHSVQSNSKIASLSARLVEPDKFKNRGRHEVVEEEDEETLFAELEAEIENDSNAALREQGLELLSRE
jgi:hypothetical protein